MVLLLVAALMLLSTMNCRAFTPDIDHRAIAGLWKLTPKLSERRQLAGFPMKEFTVHPKDRQRQQHQHKKMEATLESQGQELLLMLKEDGSFQQYAEDDKKDEDIKIPDTLSTYDSDEEVLDRFLGAFKDSGILWMEN